MGANLDITEKLQNYINNFGLSLHPVQEEIIDYNKILDDRDIDNDVGIIFGWKLTKHLGVFTEGRHLSYFNVDDGGCTTPGSGALGLVSVLRQHYVLSFG